MKRQGIAIGELALIEQIRRAGPKPGRGLVLGIGDDCAILRNPQASEILVTTDFSLEGRHFRNDLHPAESVGHRCLARGLSDLAAMGATPLAAFLSLALPGKMLASRQGQAWVERFFRGFRTLGDRCNVPLAGGDTAESPADLVLADITLVGTATTGTALRRSGGRAGDAVYCTGRLGGAAAELQAMFARGKLARISSIEGHPQLFPEPRLATGALLRKRGLATACIDLSDGLSTDLAHLCAESSVNAEIEEATLPVHPLAAKLGPQKASQAALNGGEDYELLFTASASTKMPRSLAGVAITRIGTLTRPKRGQPVVTLLRLDGSREPLLPAGWEHFSSKSPS